MFITRTVGRSAQADIVVDHETVSRLHLEITSTDAGRHYVLDRASSWGTFVWRGGEWQSLKQGYVREDETLALGKKKITLGQLLAGKHGLHASPAQQQAVSYDLQSVKPRRNTRTGAVINST